MQFLSIALELLLQRFIRRKFKLYACSPINICSNSNQRDNWLIYLRDPRTVFGLTLSFVKLYRTRSHVLLVIFRFVYEY
jgi:hypothetical protein